MAVHVRGNPSVAYLKSVNAPRLIPVLLSWLCLATEMAAAQPDLSSSTLPIVVIDTGGKEIPDVSRITAHMGIIDNGTAAVNRLSDPFNAYDGAIAIELRGSSSQMFPKKQYAVETRDQDGENNNVPLLGLPEENDWVLYAPYSDKSLLRNVLTFSLARRMGHYASRHRFVELVIDGDYRGVYVLLEQIKRDRNRVDIARLRPEDVEGDQLTGGYIIKIDKTAGENNEGWLSPIPPFTGASQRILYQYHDPEPDEIVQEQKEYIQALIGDFEQMMMAPEDHDLEGLIDLDDFVDYAIITELGRNVDGYRLSAFMYKDRDSADPKLHMGPIWDFNLAYGNADYYGASSTTGWHVLFPAREDAFQVPTWWRRLFEYEAFRTSFARRWEALRRGMLHADSLHTWIDTQVATLREPARRNFERWPVLDTYVWPNAFVGGSWEAEIEYLKDWLSDRARWMDGAIESGMPEDPAIPVTSIGLFPNPARATITLQYTLGTATAVRVEMYDPMGRRLAVLLDGVQDPGTVTNQWSIPAYAAGVYFLRLRFHDRAEVLPLVIVRAGG